MTSDMTRLLDDMEGYRRAHWVIAQDVRLIESLLAPLAECVLLESSALALIKDASSLSGDRYDSLFRRELVDPLAFREPVVWLTFWAMVAAAESMCRQGHATDYEPELNGAFLKAIEEAVRRFRHNPLPASGGFMDMISFAMRNHAKRGNEARSGGDFALIVEARCDLGSAYLVMIVQAKRATTLKVDIKRAAGAETQLEKLNSSPAGGYLFYHQHGKPSGLPPTVKSAVLVKQESDDGTRPVHPTELADDFASKVASGVQAAIEAARSPSLLPGLPTHGVYIVQTRDQALELILPAGEPERAVSDLFVARVAERYFTRAAISDFEGGWHADFENRSRAIAKGIATSEGGEDRTTLDRPTSVRDSPVIVENMGPPRTHSLSVSVKANGQLMPDTVIFIDDIRHEWQLAETSNHQAYYLGIVDILAEAIMGRASSVTITLGDQVARRQLTEKNARRTKTMRVLYEAVKRLEARIPGGVTYL